MITTTLAAGKLFSLRLDAIPLPTKRRLSWRVLFLVAGLALAGMLLRIPAIIATTSTFTPGLWLQLVTALAINWLLIGLIPTFIGLPLAYRLGVGLPLIEGSLQKKPVRNLVANVVITSVALAIVLAIVGLAVVFLTWPMTLADLEARGFVEADLVRVSLLQGISPWGMVLTAASAGINEEIAFRLGLLTLLAWLGSLLWHDSQGRPRMLIFWVANILAALAFGALHLTNLLAVGLPLVTGFIVRALVGNGIVALVLGWLYWKRGLEGAILVHFFVDVLIYVAFPPFAKLVTA